MAARVIAILVVLVIWAVFNLVALLVTRKANERMINEIAAAPAAGPGSDATATAEEVALLRERLQEALGLLKKAKLGGASGRQYLYQLPWYIIIGPPGAGKTTALVNSGLTFPLADTFGKDRIKGVGGTRFCDWWFTDEAVLIDTAGRYTTQDSQQAVDAGAWTGFLGLLKKFRPRQPINGVLIAIGLDGFMQLSETDQMAHAAAIRQRLRELHKHLDVRFPVYVLFTKCDLVAGFVEFFDDLGREDREQVWGVSFPLDEGREEGGAVARYAAEFDLLVQRLNERLVERVHKEPDMLRRGLIFGFPAQIVSLKQATDDFLKAIFTPSRLEQRLLLRGVYFTSGTQEGTPIDRLMGAMAATFGLDRQRLSAFSGAGRSYFLTRLLRGVVFKEASVVSTDRRLERRRTWMRAGAYAAIALVTLAVTAAWAVSYLGNREMIDQTAAQVALYNQQVAGQDLGRVGDADVTRVLAPLNTLRAMPAGYAEHGRSVPLSLTFGLYQGNKLGAEAIRAYRRALNAMLLPRLLLGLERYLQSTNTEGEVYAALRVYLMLGNRGPLDRGEVTAWMDAAWSGYPTEIRQQLLDHLAALLEVDEQPLIEISLDGNVIAQAQQVLSRLSQAEIALNKLAQSPAARQVPPWRIADVQGTNTVFVRRSGRPLTEGWPGLYTYNGFHLVFLPALRDVARETARESWVFGRRPGPQTGIGMLDDNDPQVLGLRREVMNLYLDRYSTQWNTVLRDIAIVPFHNRDQQVQVLNQLSGRSSPLRSLLRAISRETTLTAPLESTLPPGTDAAVVAASREAQRYVPNNAVGRIGTAFFGAGQPAAGQAAEPPGKSIDDEFRWLHDLTGTGDGTGTGAGAGAGGGGAGASPLDDIIGTMNDLMQQMAGPRIGANPAGAPPPGGGPAQRLQLQAQQVPQLAGLLAPIAQASTTIALSTARAQLDNLWKGDVLPLCTRAIANRYPFFRGTSTDVPLDDFAQLFAPNGKIDTFFRNNLMQYVDMARNPWAWQAGTVDLGIPSSVLVQFQRAATIRDAFFPAGGQPAVRFDITPGSLDPRASAVLIELDGQTVSYNQGPTRGAQLQWPGTAGPGQARVTFTPVAPGPQPTVSHSGPWAWFRLLEDAGLRGAAREVFSVTFSAGGLTSTWDLRARSTANPFRMADWREFRCPASL